MAVLTSSELKGTYPDVVFPAQDIVPDAAIFALTTQGGAVEGDEVVLRVPYVADDPTVSFVAEGAEITPDDPTLAEVAVTTGKLAVLVRQSNESARHQTAAELVASSMSHAIAVKANAALMTNATAPVGLFALTGVSSVSSSLDLAAPSLAPIIEAIVAVEEAGGKATNMVMSPATWGALLNLATSEGHPGAVALPGADLERVVLGVPVWVDASAPDDALLVIDRSQIISAVGPIRLETSDQVFFGSDSLARRGTWRIGWAAVRPTRIAKVTVTAAV